MRCSLLLDPRSGTGVGATLFEANMFNRKSGGMAGEANRNIGKRLAGKVGEIDEEAENLDVVGFTQTTANTMKLKNVGVAGVFLRLR